MQTNLMPLQCPACQYQLTAHTSVFEDAQPREKDLTVCINCGVVLVYGEGLTLTELNKQDILAIAKECPEAVMEVLKVKTAVEMVIRERMEKQKKYN